MSTAMRNCVVTLSGLTVATLFAFLFWHYVPENSGNISLVYILALITIVRFTDGYLPGLISSVIAVVCVNFLFTYPYFELNFTLSGYPVTFLGMLGVTLLTSTMTANIKEQAHMIAEKDKLLSETEKEKMRANLLRAVSHDLRTPLTAIFGYLDLLEKEETSASVQNYANIIRNRSELLAKLTEELFQYSIILASKDELSIKPVNLNQALEESIAAFYTVLHQNGITPHVRIPEQKIMRNLDPYALSRIFSNLLSNAVRYTVPAIWTSLCLKTAKLFFPTEPSA